MSEPRTAAVDDVDAWLGRIGLSRGMKLGAWELTACEVMPGGADRGVAVVFTDPRAPERVIRLRMLPSDPGRPAFARTASLDLSHEALPERLVPVAGKLLRVLHALIIPHDAGGLTLPCGPALHSNPAPDTASRPRESPVSDVERATTAATPTAAARELPDPSDAFPTAPHRDHLEHTIELSDEIRTSFRRDGHVIVRGALDPGMLLAARPVVEHALAEVFDGQRRQHTLPVGERDTYDDPSSTRITRLGRGDAIRLLARSPRLAKMAADLMGVSRVRIFCEDWFVKEPGADRTPWHQDSGGMPFDAEATITVWIPFQTIDETTGLLRFARGSHTFGVQPVGLLEAGAAGAAGAHAAETPGAYGTGDHAEDRALAFHVVAARHAGQDSESDEDPNERAFDEIIRAHGWPIDVSPPMQVGDVSFHEGSTIHGGLPNNSAGTRLALALHCFADGAVMKEPTTPAMRNYRQMWAADIAVGEPAAGHFWPLIYPPEERSISAPTGRTSTSASAAVVPTPASDPDLSRLPSISAVIHYAGDIEGRGQYGPASALDHSRVTLPLEPHVVTIHDARPIRDDLSLDREGFILASHASQVACSVEIRNLNREHRQDAPEINAAYHREMTTLVRAVTGAREVLPQTTLLIVRSSHRAEERTWAGPSGFAHIDFTETSARQFLQLVQSRAGGVRRPFRRFAIYQTWRMTVGPPQDNLLALCDGRTVAADDVVVIDTVVGPEDVPGNKFESTVCKFNPAHRWYYFSNMRTDEVLLFKAFDSDDPTANTALHSAFDDPSAPPDAAPRASIETRLFAFFE